MCSAKTLNACVLADGVDDSLDRVEASFGFTGLLAVDASVRVCREPADEAVRSRSLIELELCWAPIALIYTSPARVLGKIQLKAKREHKLGQQWSSRENSKREPQPLKRRRITFAVESFDIK